MGSGDQRAGINYVYCSLIAWFTYCTLHAAVHVLACMDDALDILFDEMSTSNYLRIAFVLELQTLKSIDFSKIY